MLNLRVVQDTHSASNGVCGAFEMVLASLNSSARDVALVRPQRLRVEQLVQLPSLAPVVAQARVAVREVEEHVCTATPFRSAP